MKLYSSESTDINLLPYAAELLCVAFLLQLVGCNTVSRETALLGIHTQESCDGPSLTAEEYLLYSAYFGCNHLPRTRGPKAIFDSVSTPSVRAFDYIASREVLPFFLKNMGMDSVTFFSMRTNLTEQSSNQMLCIDSIPCSLSIVIISRKQFEESQRHLGAERVWEAFYHLFPAESGITWLSRPVFDHSHKWALLWYSWQCGGGFGGESGCWLFHRDENHWVYKGRAPGGLTSSNEYPTQSLMQTAHNTANNAVSKDSLE